MIGALVVIVLAAIALAITVAWWENHRDDGKYPSPGASYTLSSARETRAAWQGHAGLPGATEDEIDDWLAALKRKDDTVFLTAPPPIVPGRASPPANPDGHGGDRAPGPAAETAHPAGDPGPMPSHPETWSHWHTALIPPAHHQAAKTAALDYMPRIPFANWEDDEFVEGLAAIQDGA